MSRQIIEVRTEVFPEGSTVFKIKVSGKARLDSKIAIHIPWVRREQVDSV
jgi:hypothetical protein